MEGGLFVALRASPHSLFHVSNQIDHFLDHVKQESAPHPAWPSALKALWWDAKGDWHQAHAACQPEVPDKYCDWVHAYLHRKEGDLPNASYWYARAGEPLPENVELASEWEALVLHIMD